MRKVQHERKYHFGQKLYERKSNRCAYVVSPNAEHEYLIQLSDFFPYKVNEHKSFFKHVAILNKYWRHEKEGVQVTLNFSL